MGPWSESAGEIRPETLALGPEDRLQAVGDVDLPEDVGQVRLHGLLADAEPLGDQLVGPPVEQQREHLALTRGDALEWIGGVPRLQQEPCSLWIDPGAAWGGRADGPDHLLRGP